MARPKGGYKVHGKRVPGVTTITGRFKDSGGLLWWAFKQGQLAERGVINSLYDKRDEAGEAGTLCHTFVENHIKGHEPPNTEAYDPEIVKQAEVGFSNYLEWAHNNKIRIIHQEIPLVSEKYKFGGCPDGIGTDSKGRLCLIDWKTSSGIYADYLMQLGAYQLLWEENYPDDWLVGGFHLCRFSKDNADFHHHYWSELDDAVEMFLKLREAYELDKKLKERV